MTAKRTPEQATMELIAGIYGPNGPVPIAANDAILAALREQAEVSREERAAAEKRGRREAGHLMMKLVCRPCRKKLPYDDEGNISNHSTCRRIEKLAQSLTGEGEPPKDTP